MSKCCKIPQKLVDEAMTKWACLAEQAYEVFGVDCELVYLRNSDSSSSVPSNNVPQLNSINSRRRSSGREYDWEDQTVTPTETIEQIRAKIYWDALEWKKLFGYTNIPDNAVLFFAKIEDADKLSQAVKIRYTDVAEKVYTFIRDSEPVPYGFKKNKFCSSVWIQES